MVMVCTRKCRVCSITGIFYNLIVAFRVVAYLIIIIPFKRNIIWNTYIHISQAYNHDAVTTATSIGTSAAAAAAAKAIVSIICGASCRTAFSAATVTTDDSISAFGSPSGSTTGIAYVFSSYVTNLADSTPCSSSSIVSISTCSSAAATILLCAAFAAIVTLRRSKTSVTRFCSVMGAAAAGADVNIIVMLVTLALCAAAAAAIRSNANRSTDK